MHLLGFFLILVLVLFFLICLLLILTRFIPIGSRSKEIATLAELGSKFPIQILQTQIGDIAYHQSGSGKTLILFIHGTPGLWNAFGDYMLNDMLMNRDITMIAYDRPGFGETTATLSYQLEKHALAANALIKHFKLPTIIVAHSFGSAIAADLVYEYPEYIKGMILIAPTLDPVGERRLWFKRLTQNIALSVLGKLAQKDLVGASMEMHHMPDEMERLAPKLGSVLIPITVMHGDKDLISPKTNLDYARQIFPNTSLVSVPNGNHFLPWTHEKEITEAIEKNLK